MSDAPPGRRPARRAPAGPDPRGALRALRDLVQVMPVPSARPLFARQDVAAGLTLLDLGMRMDHVQRVTENLTLIDRNHMRRAMALDVDLGTLTALQRRALAARSVAPDLADLDPALEPGAVPPGGTSLWLPVAWQSRDHAAPVIVHDGQGRVVPRLTARATWTAMSAGLARLLRNQLLAQRLALTGTSAPPLGLQSRWLIERAIVLLVERGPTAAWGRMAELAAGDDLPGPDDGPGAVRDRALVYLQDLESARAAEFSYLLDLATREQLLVAMVPGDDPHPHLRFDAAPVPVLAREPRLALRPRELLPVNREYTVEYRTQVPRRIASYHLTIEVPEEIRVRRFMLTTDADDLALEHLARDLDRMVRALDGVPPGAGMTAVEQADLQDALARVASVSRLRFTELQAYREYVRRFRARFGGELPVARRQPRTAAEVAAALAGGECDLTLLAALAVHQERGALLRPFGELTPSGRAAALATLRDHLGAAELGHGVTVDNDPRDNAAHASWRHVNLRFGPRAMEPVTAAFHLALADEPPALVESVVRMLLGLLAVLALLWFLLRDQPAGQPEGGLQSDALVAVLLLVPSILLSRLDLPRGDSVLGELRAFPRRIAYLSVILTSGVALVAAASDAVDLVPAIRAGALALLVLLALSAVELAARSVRRRARVPRSTVAPRWLAEAMGVRPRPPVPPDARFLSVGALAARSARFAGPAPRPADLVATAAATATEGSTGLAYEVVHAPRVTSTHSAAGGHALDDDCPAAGELLGLVAHGSTFEIRTRPVRDPAAIQPVERPAGFLLRNARSRAGATSRADGLVALPAGAHAPSGPASELLVVLGDHEDTSFAQARMTTHVLAEISRRVAAARALPLFLHAPAAPRPQMRTATEQPRPAVLPVIRLGLSNGEPHARARADVTEQIVDLARRYGLGLSLSEGRASTSANHWHEVVPFDRARYHRGRRARFAALGEVGGGDATMVTVVGPGTPHLAADLHALARAFEHLGLGCLAISAWSLQRAVFVNVLLPCRPTRSRSARPWDARPDSTGADLVPFARVVRECSLLPDPPDPAGPIVPGLPQRFAVVLATRTGVDGDGLPGPEREVPFWVTWDVPAPADVDAITFRLTAAFVAEGRQARVSFLRARRTTADRLRGSAKVSVGVPRSWGTAEFGGLAQRVQARAGDAVAHGAALGQVVAVQVAWGERWLGSPP